MREVITLHLGQAGIQIGQTFWELICLQHGINPEGLIFNQQEGENQYSPQVMFDQTRKGKFVSRSFWLDSDPITTDQVKKSPLKKLNHPDRYFIDKQQQTSFFTVAQFSLNRHRQQIISTIQKLFQACHLPQAIIITCSISGGTGSGYLASVLSMIGSSFPKILVLPFIIYPSRHYSSSIVEPYNALMAQTQLTQHSTANFMFTNQKMYDCCENLVGVERPNFMNVNQIVAHVMADVTAGQRFQGPQMNGLQHLITSLIPYRRLNCLTTAYAPLVSEFDQKRESLSVNEMTRNCFEKHNNLTTFKSTSGSINFDMASHLLYRGNISQLQCQKAITQVKQSESLVNLVPWSPTGISVSYCTQSSKYLDTQPLLKSRNTCCLLANTTAIRPMFLETYRKYELMYDKRAFVHWYFGYTSNGWFSEAKMNYEAMLSDYEEVVA